MSQPMLTIAPEQTKQKNAQLHLLPCRIHHDGIVDPIEPYWSPVQNQGKLHMIQQLSKHLLEIYLSISVENMKTAYLRGRKLHGKAVKLPEGYYGSVVEKGETKREIPRPEDGDEEAELQELPDAIEVAPMNGKARFDDIVIWGHESTADSSADPYVRSIEEWVSFAEQVRSLTVLIWCL
jgi:hypothetical protein